MGDGGGVPIGGFCDERFEAVRVAFAGNFAEQGELGAAVCVIHRGEVVVDLHGGWADPDSAFSIDGSSLTGTIPGSECAMNCTNDNEVFSFHPAGCNLAFADGSVRYMMSTMNLCVLAKLTTRSGYQGSGKNLGEMQFPDE